MDNTTIASPVPNSVTLPTDGPTNVWMYAVIAAATLFVIFLAVACYSLSEFFTKGPRPRRKDEEGDKAEGADNIDGMTAECNHLDMNGSRNVADVDSSVNTRSSVESDIEPSEQDHLIEENEKFIAPIAKKGTFAKEEEDVFHEYRGREPLQGRSTLPHRSRPPPIILLKSKSLEHEEAYESDDSIGNAESLRSQFSARSKMSRLSKLSVTSGPTIQIDPEEAVCKDALSPGRPVNIGFISYSSVDTEDSNAPESSASCDSDLSPRSLPSDTLSDLSPSNRKGTNGYGSDKVVKNVALDSLRMKSQMKQGGKRSDEDSGRDSLPNSLNNAQGKPEKTLIPRLDVHKVGKTSTNGRTAEGCNDTLLCHSPSIGNGGVPPHTPWSRPGTDCEYTCLYQEDPDHPYDMRVLRPAIEMQADWGYQSQTHNNRLKPEASMYNLIA
ncbi:hypothetical protein MAR_019625 [Mya arenaria]|uniref:Uncharacterized protein n=1 Tax=Mya arenaria TaxID=6604 RepID=A0ABY7EAR8_MYAAR|nr:hypothetical protein MAR_019625 [Mya arenaria]